MMSSSNSRLLVSIAYRGGIAGVFEVEGEGYWMTADVELGPSTGLRDMEPGREGLEDDRVALAGVIPDGAASCQVKNVIGQWTPAAVANGAWVVVIEDDLFAPSMVKFLTADGRIVPAPIPDNWDRIALAMTGEPCPVCESDSWEEIAGIEVFDPGDGYREENPRESVACRQCGYRVDKGVTVAVGEQSEDLDPEESRRAAERWRDEHFKSQLAEILRSDLEVYGPKNGPHEIHGSSSRPDSISDLQRVDGVGVTISGVEDAVSFAERNSVLLSLTVGTRSYPGLTVESTGKPGRTSLARGRAEQKVRYRLESHVNNADYRDPEYRWPDGEAAIALHLNRKDLEATAAGRRAVTLDVSLPIDGEPVEWIAARSDGLWVAICLHCETQIAVFASGLEFDQVAVERLTDLPSQLTAAPLPEM